MAKIFDVQDWLKNHPNRNNFDLTHKVHGSYQFGKLYPVLCKPVVPTDSFRIDTAVSLRFTPMPFPTQSNMRVIFHYFYVRNKNIWKNWSNWLQGLEEHTPPYIDKPASFYKDGSLADHLGIQTSFLSTPENLSTNTGGYFSKTSGYGFDYGLDYHLFESSGMKYTTLDNWPVVGSYISNIPTSWSRPTNGTEVLLMLPLFGVIISVFGNRRFTPARFNSIPKFITLHDFVKNSLGSVDASNCIFDLNSNGEFWFQFVDLPSNPDSDPSGKVHLVARYLINSDGVLELQEFGGLGSDYTELSDGTIYFNGNEFAMTGTVKCTYKEENNISTYYVAAPFYANGLTYSSYVTPKHLQVGDSDVTSPYASTGDLEGKIKVSALPFRAYESIYNAFYRNSQGVQPFQINGVTQYNKYITNDGDGADTTNYSLFERNWELDAYTSCLISPQQGNVPYVGITDISALGRMHVETPNGDSAEVRLSDNGDGVEISNLHGDSPEARAYALRAASSGFTIPEFREANALQRFLEMNIRKGYKYIDFIEGHFGKKPTYSEMDMPEFIGGFSQRISVNEISNTNGVDNDTLGAIAGQARAIGGSKHGINHYFDDFGFVVGIMCIVPDNAYDSILPKHFNLTNPLDCYFPEFSQLSYMPLTHEELAPLQTINDPRGSTYRDLTKVFGYQRPNHDLVWYPDTVHGLFRDASGIGNSVICRRFGVRPDLSDAFLRIKPEETDTIFNYTFGDNDVALGEIVLSIKAKRPVPRLVVPTIS